MRNFVFGLGALALTGCATSPNKIPAQYISPMAYSSYDCDQISMEKARLERRTGELYSSLRKEANADSWQMGLGLVLFWPALFLLEGGDGPEATEYARIRGEYEAVSTVSIQKKCDLHFAEDLSEYVKETNEGDAVQAKD